MEEFEELIGWAEDDFDYKAYLETTRKGLPVKWELIHYDLHNQVKRWRNSQLKYGEKALEFEIKYMTRMIEGIYKLSSVHETTTHKYISSNYLKGVYIFKK
jgi:hypothetical protein